MRLLPALTGLLLIPLAGCAATIPPVQATRFHLNQPILPGTVRIESDSSLEAVPYTAAVAQAMTRLGFQPVTAQGTTATYSARVTPVRMSRAELARSPVTVGIGGGSWGRHVGVGVGTTLGLGGSGSGEIVVTRLTVLLKRTKDQQAVWEGRAETEAPSRAPAAQPGLAAEKLADAMFRDFPGVSGETITVR